MNNADDELNYRQKVAKSLSELGGKAPDMGFIVRRRVGEDTDERDPKRCAAARELVEGWKAEGVTNTLFELLPHVHGIASDDYQIEIYLEEFLFKIAYLQIGVE